MILLKRERQNAETINHELNLSHGSLNGFHSPADRNDVAHLWSCRGRRGSLLQVAGLAIASGRLSDHFSPGHVAGREPQDVATTVASPLERHLGQIADVTEMTSSSTVGRRRITLQFDLNRDINGAARDVQAAINAARADLPTSLRSNPTYKKVNPADAPSDPGA